VQVIEYVEPGGLIVKLAIPGIGFITKLVVVEHPPVAVTVTFVLPGGKLLTEVCVGEGGPGGTGLQVTV
jgi:hypothetical protein